MRDILPRNGDKPRELIPKCPKKCQYDAPTQASTAKLVIFGASSIAEKRHFELYTRPFQVDTFKKTLDTFFKNEILVDNY